MIPIYQLPYTENPSSVEGITYSILDEGYRPTTRIATEYHGGEGADPLYLKVTFEYDSSKLCKSFYCPLLSFLFMIMA